MNCYRCDEELIWGGDHDLEDENEFFFMITNLSCAKCGCQVEVYFPIEDINNDI
jgi:hypothetical protein